MIPVRIAVHGAASERGAWDEAARTLNAALQDVARFELYWAPTREEAIADPAPILCLSLLPDLWDAASWAEVEAAWERLVVRMQQAEPPEGRTAFVSTILRHLPAEHAHRMPRLRRLNLLAPTLSHRHGLLVVDLDRDLAHRGAAALGTDATLSGPVGQRAAGLLIANVLLSYGVDRFVPDAVLDAAIKQQASLMAEGLSDLAMPLTLRRERVRVGGRAQILISHQQSFGDRDLRGLLRDLRARRIGPWRFMHAVGRKVAARLPSPR